MIEVPTNLQVTKAVDTLRGALSGSLAGAYLFGSAVTSGLKPTSDIDLMAVTTGSTDPDEKRALIDGLLSISGSSRPVELTIVVASEVKPWRYPPRMDFQFGGWWRDEFERGELEPWGSPVNPDLASLIPMVLTGNTPLLGPPPAGVFDPVPREDYAKASLAGIGALLSDLEWDTHNVVLTLARIWVTLATDTLRSKDGAADWVLRVLPSEHRRVLVEARAIYRGLREPWTGSPIEEAQAFASHAVREIHALAT